MTERTNREKAEYIERLKKQRLSLHVRVIRESKGMTQAELAEKAGYETKASIAAIENGSRLPGKGKKDVTDKDIANALGVSLDQLWGRRRLELTEKGLPKISESEKTALTLIGPMLKALSGKRREQLIDFALTLVEAERAEVPWEQTEYQKEKMTKNSE